MHIFYLHGFASSPLSHKAQLFKPQFEALGVRYNIPDLNVPSFEKLTLTAILATIADEVNASDDEDIVLIGSSLGGLSALHFYDRYRESAAQRLRKLILLAPALDFRLNRDKQLGENWQYRWRTAGSLPFFNYATGDERPVHYGLIEDIATYDSDSVEVDIPVLIYHGQRDESVDYHQSVRFAEKRPQVGLHILDSDHQLLDQTAKIMAGMIAFLELSDSAS